MNSVRHKQHLFKYLTGRVLKGKHGRDTLPSDAYDAVVVGAGPSGATLAYFASKGGAKVWSTAWPHSNGQPHAAGGPA